MNCELGMLSQEVRLLESERLPPPGRARTRHSTDVSGATQRSSFSYGRRWGFKDLAWGGRFVVFERRID